MGNTINGIDLADIEKQLNKKLNYSSYRLFLSDYKGVLDIVKTKMTYTDYDEREYYARVTILDKDCKGMIIRRVRGAKYER